MSPFKHCLFHAVRRLDRDLTLCRESELVWSLMLDDQALWVDIIQLPRDRFAVIQHIPHAMVVVSKRGGDCMKMELYGILFKMINK